jgi:Xaa-Pro aminopeptidase
MHRTSHWLGRDVHDCGDYREPLEGSSDAGEKVSRKAAVKAAAKAVFKAAAKTAAKTAARTATKTAVKTAARTAGTKAGRPSAGAGDAPEAGPPERPWRRFVPGMVLTLEPGIYVRAADDIPARFHDIGIRIEDDALVTAGGCEILTRDVPKHAAEIESLMAESREPAGAKRSRRMAA